MIGLVLPDGQNPFYAELARAVSMHAAGQNQPILEVNHHDDPAEQQRVLDYLMDRDVDYLLIASPSFTELTHPNVPTVLIDSSAVEGFSSIGPDYHEGAGDAVRHLLQVHHYESVGLLTGELLGGVNGRTSNRMSGWRQACQEFEMPEGPILYGPFSREGGYLMGSRLLENPHPPAAIFVSSDSQAFGVLVALWEHGLRLPDDMAVISFDGTAGTEFSWPPLTVVEQPLQQMVSAAIHTVLDPAGPGTGHQQFSMSLTVRQSCGCRRTRGLT